MPTSGQEFVIDLTPLPDPVRVEGALLNLVRFRGHPNPVRYAPPWTIRGNDTEARLTPPGLATGAHIRSKTLREPLSFFSDAPDDLAAVQRWALGELPACQSTPRLISHERNTLHLNRMQTVELRFEYIFQGHLTEHAVLVAPRSSHQVLLFAVYGPIKGFSDLHRVFQQSLYSLTGF